MPSVMRSQKSDPDHHDHTHGAHGLMQAFAVGSNSDGRTKWSLRRRLAGAALSRTTRGWCARDGGGNTQVHVGNSHLSLLE